MRELSSVSHSTICKYKPTHLTKVPPVSRHAVKFATNHQSFQSSVGFTPTTEENCELSDKNSHDLDINNPSNYDNSERYDFYQREASATEGAPCLDGELRRHF